MSKLDGLISNVLIETEILAMPNAVTRAMGIDFGKPVTAYLCDVLLEDYRARGIVFADRFRRFSHGNSIRTSTILSIEQLGGYVVLQTLNSFYVVCTWSAAGFCERVH